MRKKRLIGLLVCVLGLFGLLGVRIAWLAWPENAIAQAAQTHGSFTLKLGAARGTVYDSRMRPLVNGETYYVAAVLPQKDTVAQLAALVGHVKDANALRRKLAAGEPFAIEVDTADIDAPGTRVAKLTRRYEEDGLAPHLVGYLNGDGKGAAGIEKAYDTLLTQDTQTYYAYFPVDAAGRSLTGLLPEIRTDGKNHAGGVVLTIDTDIQRAAQQAAQTYLKAGAVLVMDPATGDILASVSTPSFSQSAVGDALGEADSPLLNRALTAFNVGSVFKINVAAAALENGVSASFSVKDTGSVTVAGRAFSNAGGEVLGQLDMQAGMVHSSNVYYITLGQRLGGTLILNMAQRLGFGRSYALAPGLLAAAGTLPSAQDLLVPAALANFSMGQGDFLATPVQVARMVSAVATGGLLPTPRLVAATVDGEKKMTKTYPNTAAVRVFSESTAAQLKQFLIATVNEGTGQPAKPAVGGAGGKTSTAQTGWVENGTAMQQSWFAGFYPAENPQYVIVALMQNGKSGGSDAGPVFKAIADALAPSLGLTDTGE